jgi:carboxymethylenebutenolidase
MRIALFAVAGCATAIGFTAGRSRTAIAVDEHAGHGAHEVAAPAAAPGGPQPSTNLPASGATAADRIAQSPRHGEWAVVKVGATDSVMTWVVYPERRDKAPVVLVIHDNQGLSVWARAVADQLAADGFIGIAVDLLTMRRAGNLTGEWAVDSVRAALGSLTPEEINRSLDAVGKYGMALPAAVPKYGVIGFCWGGARSFLHAAHSPTLGAAVVYYGSPPTAGQMAAIRAPVLGLYGGNDARINQTVPPTQAAMKKLGKVYEPHTFEGAGHGFLGNQGGAGGANLKAAEQAWPLTIAFLSKHLK